MQVSVITPGELAGFVNGYAPQPSAAPAPPPSRSTVLGTALSEAIAACRDDFVRECAGALWEACAAEMAVRASLLNARLREFSFTPAVTEGGELGWQHRGQPPGEVFLRDLLTASLLHVVLTYGWESIGVCAAHDCVDIYVDASRRRPRKYCSSTCLNRARVRAHRARGTATTSGP